MCRSLPRWAILNTYFNRYPEKFSGSQHLEGRKIEISEFFFRSLETWIFEHWRKSHLYNLEVNRNK